MRRQRIRNQWLMGLWVLTLTTVFALACAPATPPTPTPAPAPPKPAAPAPAAAPTAAPKPAAPAAAPTAAPKPAAPAPAPTVAAKPKTLTKWRIVDQRPEIKQTFNVMSIEKGFYREEGLDVDHSRAEGAGTLQSLLAGQADRTAFETSLGFSAVEQGAQVVLISSMARPTDFLFARPDITKVEDLVGKKVAINTVGTQPHLLFLSVFKKRGIDASKVEFVQVGGDSARMAAVLSGQVSAASGDLSNVDKMTQAGMKALVFFSDELPEERAQFFWVMADSIKNRPEVVEADLTALVRGLRYTYDHEDEAIALGMKVGKEDNAAKVRDTFREIRKFKLIDPNLTFNPSIVNYAMDQMIAQGKLKARLPLEKFVNFEIRNKVIAKLGEYKL